jgi:hypothetical protein
VTEEWKRWADGGPGAGEPERSLLETARDDDPDDEQSARVWAGLVAALGPDGGGPLGGPGAGAGPASAGSGHGGPGVPHAAPKAAGALAVKPLAVGAWGKTVVGAFASAVVLFGTYAAFEPGRAARPAAPAPAPAPATPAASGPAALAPAPPPADSAPDAPRPPADAAEPAPAARGVGAEASPAPPRPAEPPGRPRTGEGRAAAPAPFAPSGPSDDSPGVEAPAASVAPPAGAGRLAEESRLVARGRDELRRGDAAGALRTLGELGRSFPAGALAQERAALEVQALAALGRRREARERARAFLRDHPSSPLAPSMAAYAKRADGETN